MEILSVDIEHITRLVFSQLLSGICRDQAVPIPGNHFRSGTRFGVNEIHKCHRRIMKRAADEYQSLLVLHGIPESLFCHVTDRLHPICIKHYTSAGKDIV